MPWFIWVFLGAAISVCVISVVAVWASFVIAARTDQLFEYEPVERFLLGPGRGEAGMAEPAKVESPSRDQAQTRRTPARVV